MGSRIVNHEEAKRELERVRDAMSRVDDVLSRLAEQRARYADELAALDAIVTSGPQGSEVA